MHLFTRVKHSDLLTLFAPSLLVLLCTTVTTGTAAFATSDEWRQIDHNGAISKAGSADIRIPAWTGWKEKVEKSFGSDARYRTKTTSDGTELRFDYSSVWGSECHDRFIVYVPSHNEHDKSGFVDCSGKIVVPPKYIQVEHYYNGLVAVQKDHGSPWLLLDKSGNLKYTLPKNMKPQIHARFCGVASNGILAVEKGGPDIDSPDVVDGLYDLKIKKFYPVGPSVVFNDFSEGLSCFSQVHSMKDGYVDAKGKVVIPAKFDEASDFKEGVATVQIGAQRGFIDHTGNLVTKLPGTCVKATPLYEGLAAVAIKNTKGESKWGFVDKSGEVVIPAIYWVDERFFGCNTPFFREGLTHVAIGDIVHHKYGFIDKTGQWKIPPQFKDATDFRDGFALVQTGESGFSKTDWNERDGRYVHRADTFDLFVKQFGLLDKNKSDVLAALGEPNQSLIDGAIYNLNTSFCGNAYEGVEIHYDGDKVTKYRMLSFMSEGDWIEKTKKRASKSIRCPATVHTRGKTNKSS